jgi:RNA-directed DNA polymerase
MKTVLHNTYSEIISTANLLEAWKEFRLKKSNKPDIQKFEIKLMDNILALHRSLSQNRYHHSGYKKFNINDPKQRLIHKAKVRDRLLHHAVFRILYPFFDRTFIADSYSSRQGKGTHKAIKRFRIFANKVSANNTKTCWVLKSDIKKFFASIDHDILIKILRSYIADDKTMNLLSEIINSYGSTANVGLPLGNLTSQLFVNIYLNELDQFIKHKLKVKYYIRYTDDFVILSTNKDELGILTKTIGDYLGTRLKLHLHPNKTSIKTLASGIDFLGYIIFPEHTILRTTTKKRMLARINKINLPSYLGLVKYCNGFELKSELIKITESKTASATTTPQNKFRGDPELRKLNIQNELVGKEGLEPSHPRGHQILSLARLPFRHSPKLKSKTRVIVLYSNPQYKA